MNHDTQLVSFSVQSERPQILLVGQKDDGQPFVLNMQESEPGSFFIRLELHPGTYRFRYYWSDGQNTIYLDPAHTGDSFTEDLNAVITIRSPKQATPSEDFFLRKLFEPRCAAWSAM